MKMKRHLIYDGSSDRDGAVLPADALAQMVRSITTPIPVTVEFDPRRVIGQASNVVVEGQRLYADIEIQGEAPKGFYTIGYVVGALPPQLVEVGNTDHPSWGEQASP